MHSPFEAAAICAFVEWREGINAAKADVIEFWRHWLASSKAPKSAVFQELPKTANGKIQKFILRETARAFGSLN